MVTVVGVVSGLSTSNLQNQCDEGGVEWSHASFRRPDESGSGVRVRALPVAVTRCPQAAVLLSQHARCSQAADSSSI